MWHDALRALLDVGTGRPADPVGDQAVGNLVPPDLFASSFGADRDLDDDRGDGQEGGGEDGAGSAREGPAGPTPG